ncbi:alpha-L-rhamnosidase-related protein [Flavobacterium gawalongense]|uniref:Bacterial alpha-L-rhamnosidase n=1 Tax=Flavobacterium gawalongense TaxID=2594432 RepID=A0ABY3CQ61_9FLAO|nr:family 78 glycoside hydrolase catalytic domain [Flavobacterium gawalongense]TRX04491.1 Bacterial alpha-L-rhamnosidase [Flavobacterium gawalongense]TRX10378.1 Bacterial alpha-L-rhamnosidase [Flavobacterium gawalongense]
MKIKINFLAISVIATAAIVVSCKSDSTVLYNSKNFSVHNNKVIQGQNVAEVLSPTSIQSNYKSAENENYSNLISFKFSINEKDNDLAQGVDRQILVTNQKVSEVYVFGQQQSDKIDSPKGILPADTDFTFKLDMRAVFQQFKEKGFYQCSDGSKIAQADFKGVYIAGGALPLTWDFVNLEERGLKMTDADTDGIFEITLKLNPLIPVEDKTWKLTQDISAKTTYTSQQPIVDALYNLSLEEAKLAIEPDSTFRTGAKWAGVWTRDISYSIVLAFAYLEPEVAKISLLKKVKRDRIIQDTGSGGAWPVSSDRTTWALAAWEVYKTTGDAAWLKKAYTIIKNSAADDYKTIRNSQTGMYSGESSFLDWREQTYPKWMSNMDIYVSQNLGTNVVHYQTHQILSKMATILGEPHGQYDAIASEIKKGINEQLWMEDKGYYAQYLYGRNFLTPSKRFEALGEALAVLFDVADAKQSKMILSQSPLTEYGATCIYPQIPGIPPYHNNAIWPFVQSYWNLAAAKVGNEKVLNHGLASLYRAAGLFLTNYENMVADNGDFKGTEINSDRMLWSMAGNLSMVYRVFMGMEFTEEGILFHPAIPKEYRGTKKLENFKYRKANLSIMVKGYGNQIASFTIDGKKANTHFLSNRLIGNHTIEIVMKNNNFSGNINLVDNHFSTNNPQVKLENGALGWNPIERAAAYTIYKNGTVISATINVTYPIIKDGFAEYKISAVDEKGYESFTSEPILVYSAAAEQKIEVENFAGKSDKPYINFGGSGFVEVSKTQNKELILKVIVAESGLYQVDFRYSNGSGPWNTDNKCAIRSLYANGNYSGVIVMPQRGINEWSDWSYSNSHKVQLNKGENSINVIFEDWNNNMNVDENTAMLDFCRIIKL